MSGLENHLAGKLNKRKENGLLRKLSNPKGLVDFCSNDYLGLAHSLDLSKTIEKKLNTQQWLNGATGSRLLSGNSELAENLEAELSHIFRCEETLVFNSGYAANLAVLSSIPQKGDTIIYDELSHACIKDGARLSLAKRYAFRHNDLNDLENKIKKATGETYIAIESVYSMDGDLAPLHEIVNIAKKFNAHIILDEAHSTGVYGHNGSGLACHLNLQDNIDVRIHTFGKAMGVHGACTAGSKNLKQYLINFARPFIYSTALPPHCLISIGCAFKFLSENLQLQRELKNNISIFINATGKLTSRSLSTSGIQTAIITGNNNVKNASREFASEGFDIRPILSPTVPEGRERLRICLHAFNTQEEINKMTAVLMRLTEQLNLV
jgi:8-amino-7-oxononanoate synthase